ncbi:TetR/AcrR family transcriptional regulator [Haliangium sp.]|uniref:TetR/AcrR family transcriptional regulator n=1 Tax=Haliangium sp. TaxID=2663208 RepID=UPI003D0F4D08
MPSTTFFNLSASKRQRIIDAAVDEFASAPYARAKLDRIVDAAGVSKGSLYQYFDGKADLYRWLLTEYLASKKLAAIGAGAPPAGASVWTVLEHAFLAGVRFAAAEPSLAQLGARFIRDHELEPELAAVAQQHKAMSEAWLSELLTSAQQRHELRSDVDISVAVGFLLHALGEGMLDQLARRLGMSLEALLATPDASARLNDEELLALVRSVTDLFCHGAGA